MDQEIVLQMRGISKSFPGVKALDDARLEVRRGEVHVLLGENGAGKSTLMKVLSGVYLKDEGEIIYEGKPVEIRNIQDARKLGISIIPQELNMLAERTIAQNIYLGREPRKNPYPRQDAGGQQSAAGPPGRGIGAGHHGEGFEHRPAADGGGGEGPVR